MFLASFLSFTSSELIYLKPATIIRRAAMPTERICRTCRAMHIVRFHSAFRMSVLDGCVVVVAMDNEISSIKPKMINVFFLILHAWFITVARHFYEAALKNVS